MNKETLYKKITDMLPVEYIGDKGFCESLSEHLRIYQGYLEETEDVTEDIKTYSRQVCERIREIVRSQYKGLHSQAFKKLSNLLSGTEKLESLKKFFSISSQLKAGNSLYRARVHQICVKFIHKDMFHIPFDKRGLVKTHRYSFPGYPCLYMGESVYTCWEEMHRTDFDLCMISRLENIEDLNLLDMRIPTKEEYNRNTDAVLRRFPLLIACMTVVKNMDDVFKPEYIIPQLLTEWIITQNGELNKNKGKEKCEIIHGIRYTSSLKSNEFDFPKSKLDNIAIYPIKTLEGKNHYCPELVKSIYITDPTCNEYERLKYGTEMCWECNATNEEDQREANYKQSDFYRMEKTLKNTNKFPLHKINV